MRLVTTHRLAGAAAVTTLALGLAACGADSGSGSDPDGAAALTPAELVLASYDGLQADSYTMETTLTLDDQIFATMTNLVEGEAGRATQDLHMGVLLEAMGDEALADPALAGMMEAMLSDMRTETILIDGVVYLQISGGLFGGLSGQFGEDAWFTVDLAEHADLNEIYEQIGGFDLASQTETLLTELSDVQETGDGVYTGTLSGDAEFLEQMVGSTGTVDGSAVIDEIEVVITVDGDGLLESMEMTMPEIEGLTMHVVSEIVEVGGDYDIAAPDSDNIHPFEDFIAATQ